LGLHVLALALPLLALAVGGHAQGDKVSRLIADLASPDHEVRLQAVHTLGTIAVWEAATPLIAVLGDPEADVRSAATDSLEQVGDVTVPLLVEGLKSDAPTVRAGCADVLGRFLGSSDAEEEIAHGLLGVVKDPEVDVRYYAAVGLGHLEKLEAAEALKGLVRDPDLRVRTAAATSLAQLGDPSGVPVLLTAARQTDPALRRAAIAGLGIVKSPQAIQALVDLTGDAEDDVRQCAYCALLMSGAASSAVPGLAGLGDPEWRVRVEVARTLGFAPVAEGSDRLLETLQNDSSGLVRVAAAVSLGFRKEKRAIQPLLAMLGKDHRDLERSGAAQALGLLAAQEAIKPLTDVLEDEDARVRRSARLALQMILEDCPDCPK
jgi:HEAT repeat protein